MTTAVIVEANHGWNVRVTQISRGVAEGLDREYASVVAAGAKQTFFVWRDHDILVSEIAPDDAPPLLAPPPDE